MDLVEVVDQVVTMEGVMAMLEGVEDIATLVVVPSNTGFSSVWKLGRTFYISACRINKLDTSE